MKKGILLLILLIVTAAVFSLLFQTLKGKIRHDFTGGLPKVAMRPEVTKSPAVTEAEVKKSIFVPYWSLKNIPLTTNGYDTVLYFGVTPTTDGLEKSDEGYKKLSTFKRVVGSDDRKLVLRMTEKETSQEILKRPEDQQEIIYQTVTTAKEYGFSGVVLDLELSALPFDSLVKQVSSFAEAFAKDTSQNNLDFAMILYGDTFYRVRPFDLKTLAKIVPSFYVMAYDFHKAGGNPGPNFPFSGKETYGYDYQTMVDNFLEYVSPEKLTIIYGMYGYDWEIGNNGKAVGDGQAKSLLQIKTSIIDRCEMLRCKITHDTDASETTLTYTDNEHKKHVVWFEDEQSLKKKETFAKTMGISKFSYWAYSYF